MSIEGGARGAAWAGPPWTFRRIDPAQRVRRFYHLAVQPDLFGRWCVVREWGRIGSPGRMVVQPFATEAEADAAAVRLCRQKARKGYRGVP